MSKEVAPFVSAQFANSIFDLTLKKSPPGVGGFLTLKSTLPPGLLASASGAGSRLVGVTHLGEGINRLSTEHYQEIDCMAVKVRLAFVQ
jgi:hypothetical protein